MILILLMERIRTLMYVSGIWSSSIGDFDDYLEDYLDFKEYDEDQVNDLADALIEHPALTKILDDALFSYARYQNSNS